MKLLLRREQTSGMWRRVKFKLWGKVEFDSDEQEIVSRYHFDETMLLQVDQPTLLRKAIAIAVLVTLLGSGPLTAKLSVLTALATSAIAGALVGFWYYHKKRETIYVRDLIHGRHFVCDSVIDLIRKEATLEAACYLLRQVMESARHWDGTESIPVIALPKEDAKRYVAYVFRWLF